MDNWKLAVWAICLVHVSLAENNYFWHITDFHMDPSYGTTGDSCNVEVYNPGPYGDFQCDAPYKLVKSSVMAMNEHGKDPDFVVYTGDTPPHDKDYSRTFNKDVVISYLKNSTDMLRSLMPNTKVVMAIGNHDYYPKNQLPGENNDIYTAMADLMGDWLGGEEAVTTFKKGAFYTRMMVPEKKLRVVALNTNLYLTNNMATRNVEDPGGQFAWFEEVLATADANAEKVYVFAHIPPGVKPAVTGSLKHMREEDNVRLNNIIRKYGSVIVGFFSCHEHFDSFRVVYDKGEPVASLLIAPSVTPWRYRSQGDRAMAHNPGVRKISYSADGGELTNIEQYYLDMSAANIDDSAAWEKLYSYQDAYGMLSITPRSLHDLTGMLSNDYLFQKYYKYLSVGVNHKSVGPCGCECVHRHRCSFTYVNYDEFDWCFEQAGCAELEKEDEERRINGISIAPTNIVSVAMLTAMIAINIM